MSHSEAFQILVLVLVQAAQSQGTHQWLVQWLALGEFPSFCIFHIFEICHFQFLLVVVAML